MKSAFVNITNTSRFLSAAAELNDRGAGEACFAVVDGVPGLGKTETMLWWAGRTAAVYLRAKQEWTPSWLLHELLEALDEPLPAVGRQKMFGQALERLGERLRFAAAEEVPFAVVIDEVDYVSRREAIVNVLRDLTDATQIPFILVGMGRVRSHLTRFPQVASRVAQYVTFEKVTVEDARALVDGLCEVPVADDLVSLLHRVSQGLVREIKEGIAAIERHSRPNGGGSPVTVADMAGKVLLNDRASGKPIRVRP